MPNEAVFFFTFIGLFILLVLLGVFLQPVFAAEGVQRLPNPPDFKYYYKTVGIKLNEIKPEICLFEPEDDYVRERFWKEDWFGITTTSLNEWRWNLQAETGIKDGWTWNYRFFLLDEHRGVYTTDLKFRECNMFMVFKKLSDEGIIGQAAANYKDSFHGYTFISIWTQTEIGGSTTMYIGKKF